jgi:hypothetical protein
MDRSEAQQILSALRPGGVEANEPLFAEALALAETDPELNAWWNAQQEFDRRVASRLAEVPVPEHLRESLLAAPKVIAFPPRWHYRAMLAVAALVAILCVAANFWIAHEGPMDREDFTDQAVGELGTNGPQLAKLSSNHDEVKAWLKERNAPVGQMPSKVAAMPSIGCQKYVIAGHVVSLICFTLANGREAHLFTVSKEALKNPPTVNVPQFDKMNGWNVASWSDDHMSYLLATDGSMDDLKQMLSSS